MVGHHTVRVKFNAAADDGFSKHSLEGLIVRVSLEK
jgi:hypothetical protein